jgi:hypothetical protein
LIKVTRTRLAAGAAAVAFAAGGIGLTAVSASASSAACTGATGTLAGSCSDEVTASGTGWAVANAGKNGTAKARTAVVAVANAAGVNNGSTDFYAHQTNANANERAFEWAPKGKQSGLCISVMSHLPSYVYVATGLMLQRCNGSTSQEFYGLGDTQNDQDNANGGIQWLNAATGQVAAVTGTNVVMRSLDAAAGTPGSYFHWAD